MGVPTTVAAVLLAACATPPEPAVAPYPAPRADQPHARLLVRAAVGPADRYLVTAHEDGAACRDPRLLGRGTAQQGPDAQRLRTDRPITLELLVLRAGGAPACLSRWSFQPHPGRTYLVQAATVGSHCGGRLVDATAPDRLEPPADLLQRSSATVPCIPLAQAQRVRGPLDGGQHRGDAVLNPRATARDLEGLIPR